MIPIPNDGFVGFRRFWKENIFNYLLVLYRIKNSTYVLYYAPVRVHVQYTYGTCTYSVCSGHRRLLVKYLHSTYTGHTHGTGNRPQGATCICIH